MPLTPEKPIFGRAAPHGEQPGPHADIHLGLELGVVISGQWRRQHGRGWFALGPGQAWCCAPFEPHRWDRGSDDLYTLQFFFLPSLLARTPKLEGFDPTAIFRSPARFGAIGSRRRLRRVLKATASQVAAKGDALTQSGPAYVGLLCILDVLSPQEPGDEATPLAPADDVFQAARIQPALELAERCADRRVTLAEAARAAQMTERSFVRLFGRVTGAGFAQYALRSRLAQAAHALRSTDWPIKLVGHRFGFRCRSHFNHAFTALYGTTPGCYRRQTPQPGRATPP
jgi:AraC-like DNA-binding protein